MRFFKLVIILSMFVSSFSSGFPTILPNVDRANAIMTENSDCDWTNFTKNPEGNRIASDGCGPTEKDPSLLWSFRVDSRAWSTPIVSNNKTYIKTESNRFYCIDVRTGKKKWDTILGIKPEGVTPSSSSSACVYNGKVYIGSYDNKMHCLDAETGEKKWEVTTNGVIWSSPVEFDKKLYFGSDDGSFYCVDPENGQYHWTYKTGGKIMSSATFLDDNVYFGSNDSKLYCLNKDSGTKVWSFIAGTGSEIESTPTIVEDKIYIGSYNGKIYCINAKTGAKMWDSSTTQKIRGSVLVINEKLYFCSWEIKKQKIAKLTCMDANNGKVLWENLTASNTYFGSSPVFYNKKILYVASNMKLLSLDPSTGKEIWSYQLQSSSPNTYPVVIDKRILVSSYNNTLYCFGDGNAYSPPTPWKIIIKSTTKKVDPCMSQKFIAQVFDQYDEPFNNPVVEWSVENPEYGTIDKEGLFTPAKKGKVKIVCQIGKITESVEIEILDFLSFDKQTLTFENLEPDKQYTQTITLTSNSDSSLPVSLSSDFEKLIINPTKVTIEPNEPKEVKITYTTKDFKPGETINFKLTAAYGKCIKEVEGVITCVSSINCLKADKQTIDFGFVKRGETKSISLQFSSENPINISVISDTPWLTISKANIQVTKEPTTLNFTIVGSVLPAINKLTAKITIKSDSVSCNILEIPVSVETNPGIVLKLQLDSKKAHINDIEKILDAPPTVINGRTMVPLRFISDAFGCEINWSKEEQKISITRYDMKMVLWVGKNQAEINGQQVKIDAPPVIVGGRTMVPLRFIAEPFGAKVEWNAQTKEITIIWPKP